MKKRVITFVLAFLTLFLFLPSDSFASENAPTRVINVVYDDSGSMIGLGGNLVDTWCQAKYSMEVFAALLGPNDTMNVYVMSEYDADEVAAKPRLVLKGSAGAEANVREVHDMITAAGNTPFGAVRKAYEDLTQVKADEKWLLILTDGEFEDGAFTGDQVDAYLAQKQDDIYVMFLAMGADAASIKGNEENHIYFEKAQSNDQILNKVTDISTMIFDSNKLEVDVSSGKFSFDIPMSELVVFAQGENVQINGINAGNGTAYKYDKPPVGVKYSETPSSRGYANFIVDRELVGSVATFTGDFAAGDYTADVSGAKTIEVYYKPNVEIMLYLEDESGEEAAYTDGVRAGNYKIGLGFVKAGTTERVAESKLLGNIKYSAHVRFNDKDDPKEYKPGDPIVIEEGSYVIDASANYLKYHNVDTQIEFGVFRDKELVLTRKESPSYELDRDGFTNNSAPIIYEITLEGQPVTAQEWANFDTPVVEQTKRTDRRVNLRVEKSDEPGLIYIYPELSDGKTVIGDYSSIDYRLSVSNMSGKSSWTGTAEDTCEITDLRSWFWKHIDKVIKLAILAAVVLLILGYIPGIKKYLPKKLKRSPDIKCESKVGMYRVWHDTGRYTKKSITTFLPYKAESGIIRFAPIGEAAPLKVKAIGGNRMEVVNTKDYIGAPVAFGGKAVAAGTKKNLQLTAGAFIKTDAPSVKYECFLNR